MGISKQKVLITGGMGNLGSWLTHYFCAQGHNVSVLTKRVRKLEFDYPFDTILCDISDLETCKEALKESYDVIIHTASMNDNFVDNYPQDAIIVNALGTRNILEAVKEHPPKNFIYLSTFHVYGVYGGPISEETDLRPMNDYGTTHLFAEYYVKQFNRTHQIPYTIIRLSNSYGCPKDYSSSKWYLILNDLSKMAVEKQEIVLRGNGLASRDFIWMGDVRQILHQLAQLDATNETYNLSGGKAYTLLEVAEAVKEAYEEYFEKPIEVEVNQEDKSTPRPHLKISNARLKKVVPYEAEPHFKEEALKIFSFLENKPTDG